MKVRLEVRHKSGKKKTVSIHSDAVIGRSSECSLRIASQEISRQHCKLTVMESGVLVRDLASANGTWVNGKMIPPDRDIALTPGSRLSIGPVQFVVHYESSNPALEAPGSTVEMPVVRADTPPEAAAEKTEHSQEGAPEPSPVDDAPADEDDEDVATVVVAPGEIQHAIADADVGETEVRSDETGERGTAPVEDVPAAEKPGKPKGGIGAMIGGLLSFGRKSKTEEPPPEPEADGGAAAAETAGVTTTADDTIAPPPVAEETAGNDLDAGVADEVEADEEGEYADEAEPDGEYEDEEEVDGELGDFFKQFE